MRIYCERLGAVGTVYGLAIWIDADISADGRIVYYVKMKHHSGLIAIKAEEADIQDERLSDMKMMISKPPKNFVCLYWERFPNFEAFSLVLEGDWEQESIFEAMLLDEDRTS